MKGISRTALGAAIVMAIFALGLVAAGTASAADYATERFECRGTRGGGQVDARGVFYVACDQLNGVSRPHIKVYDATGALKQLVMLDFADGAGNYATDVAPSPDGSFLYVVRKQRAWRLVRQPDASYLLDKNWQLATYPYPAWGGNYPALGEFIATDNQGFVYFSSGTWTSSPPSVVKYAPDGRFITRFGDKVNGSWQAGEFWWMLAGIAVTADGRSVYTTEVGNNRVQRFDAQLDGSYRPALMFGNTAADDNPQTATNEARDGICNMPGKFAAPYDVALDGAGNVYVVNTSCFFADASFEVQKFTAAGQWLATLKPTSALWDKVHALGVDARGNVYLAQANTVLRAPAQPAGDATAPMIRSVVAPQTTQQQTITVTIDAGDNVAVTQMRLANENQDITATPWSAFANATQHTLSAGYADKTITVQVRDAAGNVSQLATARTVYTAPAPQGTAGDDTLTGTAGDDTINALAGNDRLEGLGGDDALGGDDGNDSVSGGSGADTLRGGAGNDSLDGYGYIGDADAGVDGTDRLYGEAGDDTLTTRGPGAAPDYISCGDGIDHASLDLHDEADLTCESFSIYGSETADAIVGTNVADGVFGYGGNDRIETRGGNDTPMGGEGDDTILGEAGNDHIQGGGGSDKLYGGDGDDQIFTGLNGAATPGERAAMIGDANNLVSCGPGADSAWLRDGDTTDGTCEIVYLNGVLQGAGPNVINGTDGNDALTGTGGADEIHGLGGNDQIIGGNGADTITAGAGDDEIWSSVGPLDKNHYNDAASDKISCGDGNDVANIEPIDTTDGTCETLNIISTPDAPNQHITGGAGNDTLAGGSGIDQIEGYDSNDTVNGNAGNDILNGGDGLDSINGGDGDDTIHASEGPLAADNNPWNDNVNDAVTCGTGTDTAYLGDADTADDTCEKIYRNGVLQGQAPADATAPTITSATTPATTQTQTITVAIDAADNVAVTQMRLANENEDVTPKAWVAFASPVQHTLTAGGGNKTITVQVRDAAGNTSTTKAVTTTYTPPAVVDTTAPVVNAVTLPNPTYQRTITVAINATDNVAVTHMRLATEDGNWQLWQPFSAQATFTLSANYGYKGVFVQVRDGAGRESNILYRTTNYMAGAPAPAPIEPAPVEPAPAEPAPVDPVPVPVADVAAPKVNSVTLPATTTTQTIAVTIDATDDKAVTMMRLANEDGIWKAWKAFASPTPHTLTAGTGTKGVFVQVRDAAGKESNIVFTKTRVQAAIVARFAAARSAGKRASQTVVSTRRSTMEPDRIRGTRGNDLLRVNQYDRTRDIIDCGDGRDIVIKRPEDRTRNCEQVIVTQAPYR